jgi:YidC/Oxa1 family membrane protein insertase
MDRNSIIGLLLIAAIVIGFSIFNQPSQKQLEEERRSRDSIHLVEMHRVAELEAQAQRNAASEVSENNVVSDFFNFQPAQTVVADSLQDMNQSSDSLWVHYQTPIAEETVVLENERIRLTLSTRGGGIKSVQLKDYLRFNGAPLYLFETEDELRFNLDLFNRNSVRLSTEDQIFTPIRTDDGKAVIMRLQSGEGQYIDFVYTLPADEYMMDFDIRVVGMRNGLHPESLQNFRMNWEQKVRQQEKGRTFENRFTRMHYKFDRQDVKRLSESKNETVELSDPIKWFAFKSQFFTSVVIGERPFNTTILTSNVLQDPNYLKAYKAEVWVPSTIDAEQDLVSAGFNFYFGPVHFNTLKAYDAGIESDERLKLEEQVFLGYRWLSWINKWFVIPLFDYLLSLGWGMGLIIFIMTLIVKIVVSPLTYKSFMSTAKMRVLRPQVQELEKKYPGQDREMMMKRQQATMELYNRVGANPMSGCLPMLIQMPVLISLFFFFPSAIELRQQSFLWASDLSSYDDLISWSADIPLITRFLGNHVSIFCLLMTITNVLYMRHTMAGADTGQQALPGMKHMPIFMSVFMFFFLNSYPAGLNYYYFLSTLFTVVIMFIIKKSVDEKKILAQLEANKNKPKKKSGFMARLAEAQKLQEQQARERAKAAAKGRR